MMGNLIGDFSKWRIPKPWTEAAVAQALERAKAAGLVAALWKSTEGIDILDPTYLWAQKHCRLLGIYFGAYHFYRYNDTDRQVQWFLSNVNFDGNTICALDFEDGAVAGAEVFVQRIHSDFGLFPLLYTNRSKIIEQIGAKPTYLSNCDLWVASYLPAPELPPQWLDWTIWQHSNGQDGPE